MTRYWLSFSELHTLFQRLLTPHEIHKSVEEIDMRALYQQGRRTVFLDLDNTLLPYHEQDIRLQKSTWVQAMISLGFRIILVSNNRHRHRVNRACEQLTVPGLYFACKPFTYNITDFCQRHTIPLTECIVIGDQVLTDIVFANWLNAYGILVDPLNKRTSMIKMAQRELELFLLKKLGTTQSS